MMLRIAKLSFKGPVHFGQVGIGIERTEEIVHSDTLFSAFCHSWAGLYGRAELDKLISLFLNQSPPFLLSSCFIYNGDTYFLPKPHTYPPGFELAEVREEYGKFVKKITYLPREIFDLWIKREKIDYESFAKDFPEYGSSYVFHLVPRVSIGRIRATSQIYHCGAVVFKKGCGLYFLVKFNDPSYEDKVKRSFSHLGELGLGGERSQGFGKFDLTWDECDGKWDELFRQEGDGFLCISLFHPDKEELNEELVEGASYALLERRGWFHSPFSKKQYKRKSVSMFAEGSVFGKKIRGHLVDVTPEAWKKENLHPIYRYGFALTVKVKRGEIRK